jgi:predicted transposase YdaD
VSESKPEYIKKHFKKVNEIAEGLGLSVEEVKQLAQQQSPEQDNI